MASSSSSAAGVELVATPAINSRIKDADTIEAEDVFKLVRQSEFKTAQKLLEKFPEFWTAQDEDGHTVLHWAALVDEQDFCALALSKGGIDVDARAHNLQTPLMWAVLKGNTPTARLLLDAKAELRFHDSMGATPLMIAAQHKKYSSILLLVHRAAAGAGMQPCLDDVDKNGCTVGHWAAYKGDDTALKYFDYFGANLLALDNNKMLPLHRAVFSSQVSVVQFLVEHRSDLEARNSEGKSCLDIAEQQQDTRMQNVLKRLIQTAKIPEKDRDPESLKIEDGGKDGKGGNEDDASLKGFAKSATKDKHLQKAFPVFWLVCVSLAVFQYLVELRVTGWNIAPILSFCFELGVPLSLALFAFSALSDPGIVNPKARGNSGVEELMRMIDGGCPPDQVPDTSRLCTTTWVLKDLRTKFCSQTNGCVREFDHYCVWLNCAIGRGNHRQFVCLAVMENFTQVCHMMLVWETAKSEIVYKTFGGWVLNSVATFPLMGMMFMAHMLTAPWIFMLVLHQFRLIAQNLTTNELMNSNRYEHFWKFVHAPGHINNKVRVYNNPFDKGGMVANTLDFWWARDRSRVAS